MRQKNIFSKDIFCQQVHTHSQFVTTTCHRHVTQNKKNSPCHGHSCQFQNFTTSGWHYDMLATCWQQFQLSFNDFVDLDDFDDFVLRWLVWGIASLFKTASLSVPTQWEQEGMDDKLALTTVLGWEALGVFFLWLIFFEFLTWPQCFDRSRQKIMRSGCFMNFWL